MGELHVLASGQGKGGLTEAQKKMIEDTVNNLPKSKETQIYDEIKAHPEEVSENVSREGYSKSVNVSYDATTEETKIDDISDQEMEEDEEFNLDDVEVPEIEYEVLTDDVKAHSELSAINLENMSDEAALELVKLINRTRKGDKIKFADLPEEIRDNLKEYMDNVFDVPVSDFSEKSNRIRNEVADAIMQEFIRNIEIDKYTEHYNYKVEHLFDDTISDISPIFKQYNDATNKHFTELVENADTPEKKEIGEAILAAIQEAYDMSRIIKAIPHTRIKKFEVGKPNRVFDSMHGKYTSPKYHLYNLYGCAVTLSKHLFDNKILEDAREARDAAIKIMLVFCNICKNYKVENTAEHTFMYYFTYNIYLLDIYKGEQYDQYVEEFLKGHVKRAIDTLVEFNK